jgi:tyramine---L-glutamate ligase
MPPLTSMTGMTRKLTGVILSRPTPTILVHEWVTGGGMAGSTMPPSWAAEGCAMRRAIARDFAAIDGGRARVVATLDDRLEEDSGPWTVERITAGEGPRRMAHLASEADFTVLIAPETTGTLAGLTRLVQDTGTRLLGSSAEAIELAGNKAALAEHLRTLGIDTPPCRVIAPGEGLPRDATYPAVIKPIDGAGTVDTFYMESPERLHDSARRMGRAILQTYVTGKPMSASFLVDASGRAWMLGIGEQDVVVRDGRFRYMGGRIPVTTPLDERPMRAAVESVPGLRGFVGVDFIWDERRRHATVLEINPRPTTSIVALVRLLPPGRLAAAWIGALELGSAGKALLPDLAAVVRAQPPIGFDASGTVFAS